MKIQEVHDLRFAMMEDMKSLHWKLDLLLAVVWTSCEFHNDAGNRHLAKYNGYAAFNDPELVKRSRETLERITSNAPSK